MTASKSGLEINDFLAPTGPATSSGTTTKRLRSRSSPQLRLDHAAGAPLSAKSYLPATAAVFWFGHKKCKFR